MIEEPFMEFRDTPTKADIERISAYREPGSVSIFLPTGTTPPEAERARIELKNHLAQALKQLEKAGVDKKRIAAIQHEGDVFIEDREFWRYQPRSLAVFLNGDVNEAYRIPDRLASTCDVAERFSVRPLLRVTTFPHRAFILALAGDSVRLIRVCPEEPPTVVEVPGIPRDVSDAVGPIAPGGRNSDLRHQGEEGHKVRMLEYATAVERAVRPILIAGADPLIVAAAEPLNGIFRNVNTYQLLVDELIPGSPEEKSEEDLASAARSILDKLYATKVAKLKEDFGSRVSAGTAVVDLNDVARAATYGAVEILIVDVDGRVPGTIDEVTGEVTLTDDDDSGNYGVVDEIVRRSFPSRAKVYALQAEDVPGGGPVAAAIRFPLPSL
jgi:hypothetical protein